MGLGRLRVAVRLDGQQVHNTILARSTHALDSSQNGQLTRPHHRSLEQERGFGRDVTGQNTEEGN